MATRADRPRPNAGRHTYRDEQDDGRPAASRDAAGQPDHHSGSRAVRARLLLLLGTLAAGIGVGLLLTASVVPGLAMVAGALLLSGGGFALGVYPTGLLVRRLRQAPAVGLIGVGLVTMVLAFSWGAVVSVLLGLGVLVADAALARKAATGESFSFSIPSPRSLLPRSRRSAEDGQPAHSDDRYPDGDGYEHPSEHPSDDDARGDQIESSDPGDSADLGSDEPPAYLIEEADDESVSVTRLREPDRSSPGRQPSRSRSA